MNKINVLDVVMPPEVPHLIVPVQMDIMITHQMEVV
jgi:hypothetical protein